MKQLFILLLVVWGAVACGGNAASKQVDVVPTDVTEVLYFHGKQRCITCNAIERLAKEVVDSLADAQVVMRIIDISKPENEALADKYEVSWSSLIVVRDGKSTNLTKMGFGYAKGQPSLFKSRLREAITTISH